MLSRRRCIQRRQVIDHAHWDLALMPAVALQASRLASAATSERTTPPFHWLPETTSFRSVDRAEQAGRQYGVYEYV